MSMRNFPFRLQKWKYLVMMQSLQKQLLSRKVSSKQRLFLFCLFHFLKHIIRETLSPSQSHQDLSLGEGAHHFIHYWEKYPKTHVFYKQFKVTTQSSGDSVYQALASHKTSTIHSDFKIRQSPQTESIIGKETSTPI